MDYICISFNFDSVLVFYIELFLNLKENRFCYLGIVIGDFFNFKIIN